jgi:transcriptional regulator with XRE-family HTH domain
MRTLTRTEVVDFLLKKKGDKSLRKFGEELDLSSAYLSDVIRGNREPGKAILTLLGVERTKTVKITYTKKGRG